MILLYKSQQLDLTSYSSVLAMKSQQNEGKWVQCYTLYLAVVTVHPQ